jgi:hypothetical protein
MMRLLAIENQEVIFETWGLEVQQRLHPRLGHAERITGLEGTRTHSTYMHCRYLDQGLITFSPAASKGLVSRVAIARPVAAAVAAM